MLDDFVESTEAGGVLRTPRAVTVGSIVRDDLAHVVYNGETRISNPPVSHTGLVVLRRDGAAWKVDPGDGAAVLTGSGGPMQIMMQAALPAEMNEIRPDAGKM